LFADVNIPDFRHCLPSVAQQWSLRSRCLAMSVWGHLTLIQVRVRLFVPVFSELSPRTSRDGDTAYRTRCPRCLLKQRQIGNFTTLSVSVPYSAGNSMFTMCRACGGMIIGRGNRGTQRKTTTQSHSLCYKSHIT
jgi:hypothetical protein